MSENTKVLFSNPPWWEELDICTKKWVHGIRAGSRWPYTITGGSKPNYRCIPEYTPYPFFLAFATSYVQKQFPVHTIMFRDSIASKESYFEYYKFIKENEFDIGDIYHDFKSYQNSSDTQKGIRFFN